MEAIRYFLIEASSKRRGFVLVAYTRENDKRKYLKLSDKLKGQCAKINKQFKDKVIKHHEAKALFQELINNEYRRNDVRDMVLKNSQLSTINHKLFNQFWAKVYGVRFLVDENSPRYDILKAIKLIEPLSLATATEQEFQTALKKSSRTESERRRAIDRLNQVLKFIGRDFTLRKPPKGLRTIQYITKAELDRVLGFVNDPVERDCITTLFGSGMRLSEALALDPQDFNGEQLNIHKQLPINGELKLPKRGKTGRSVVLKFALEATERWCAVENKADYRYRIIVSLQDACRKAFPTQRNKWVSPHDLRHSHAIHLLGQGASITQVALNLRNRVDVCQEYYTGFAHTDDTLEGLKKLL